MQSQGQANRRRDKRHSEAVAGDLTREILFATVSEMPLAEQRMQEAGDPGTALGFKRVFG